MPSRLESTFESCILRPTTVLCIQADYGCVVVSYFFHFTLLFTLWNCVLWPSSNNFLLPKPSSLPLVLGNFLCQWEICTEGSSFHKVLLEAFGCSTFTTFHLFELLIHLISSRFFFPSRFTGSNFCAEFYQGLKFASFILKVVYYSIVLKERSIAHTVREVSLEHIRPSSSFTATLFLFLFSVRYWQKAQYFAHYLH